MPVTDSATFAYGPRSAEPSSPSASRRAAIDAASFLRGRRSAMAPFWRTLRPMPAQMIDGKALAAKVREEVAAEVAELGDVGLTTVLVGDDPASDVYVRASTGRDRRRHPCERPPAAGRHPEDELLAARRPERRRLGGRHPGPAPSPSQIDEVKAIEGSTPEGRRRLPPDERRPALPRAADLVPGDAARDHADAAEYGIETRAHTLSWSAGRTSSASRWRACSSGSTRRSRSATRGPLTSAAHVEADILVAAVGRLQ